MAFAGYQITSKNPNSTSIFLPAKARDVCCLGIFFGENMTVKNKITFEQANELFVYCPETGLLTWKISRSNKAIVGNEAGWEEADGYRRVSVGGKNYRVSVIAFVLSYGYTPEHDVDHVDRVRNNNKLKNLRELTRSCNAKNGKIRVNNTSGVTGVYFDSIKMKWGAQIAENGKKKRLGVFKTLESAVVARRNAEIKNGYCLCNSKTSAEQFLSSLV